jgi:hypothetical protein
VNLPLITRAEKYNEKIAIVTDEELPRNAMGKVSQRWIINAPHKIGDLLVAALRYRVTIKTVVTRSAICLQQHFAIAINDFDIELESLSIFHDYPHNN